MIRPTLYSTLPARYPCCAGRALFLVLPQVRQTYRRRCPRCGRPWRIVRIRLDPAAAADALTLLLPDGDGEAQIVEERRILAHALRWTPYERRPDA